MKNQLEGNFVVSTIIGIGLNVNESEFNGLPQATSMKLATGITFNREEVLELMTDEIQKQLKILESGNTEGLKTAYETALFRKDMVSAFEDTKGFQFNGLIVGVSNSGELLVETEDETLKAFESKQIRLLF